MAIEYSVVDGQGGRTIGWDWQFDADQPQNYEITPSYSVWIVPGTTNPMED